MIFSKSEVRYGILKLGHTAKILTPETMKFWIENFTHEQWFWNTPSIGKWILPFIAFLLKHQILHEKHNTELKQLSGRLQIFFTHKQSADDWYYEKSKQDIKKVKSWLKEYAK